MTIDVFADTEISIQFCCTEYLGGSMTGGSDAAGGVGLTAPMSGTYRITGGTTFHPTGGGVTLDFGWMEAWFAITDQNGIEQSYRPDYGRCHTNYGSIKLATEFQLQEGDIVTMHFWNRSSFGVTLSDTSNMELSYVAGPLDLTTCGGQESEPSPPVDPVDYITLYTDGLSPRIDVEDATVNTLTWIAPEDLYITEFCITEVLRDLPGELPVLNVLVDGSLALQLDSGDILDGEFPRCYSDPIFFTIPYFVTAGQTIQFQNEEMGASSGHLTVSVVGADETLAWLEP